LIDKPPILKNSDRPSRKLTRQRQIVLDILKESSRKDPSEHLDVERIFRIARERNSKIGIATIYRALAFLKEAGLIHEYQFGQGHSHFEAVQEDQPHYHFTCLQCGRILEFKTSQVTRSLKNICSQKNLQLVEIRLELFGYCPQCQADRLKAGTHGSSA